MTVLRVARLVLLVLALAAFSARFFLVWNTDRDGGVDSIYLRSRPGLDWRQLSNIDPPPGPVARIACGNENGVVGEDFVAWNARYGWWCLPIAAAVLALFNRRKKGDRPR